MFGAIAHFERRLISERTRDGLRAAAVLGRHPGRPQLSEGTVSASGQLILHRYRYGIDAEPNLGHVGMSMKRMHVGDRVIPFHSDLMLAGDGPNGELLQLVARFTHDKLEWVRLLADYPSETLDILAS